MDTHQPQSQLLPAVLPYGALPSPASPLGAAARQVDAAWTALIQSRAHTERN